MIVVIITRPAKCKDCIFIQEVRKPGSFRKRHKCRKTNDAVRLNDIVCDDWKLIEEKEE